MLSVVVALKINAFASIQNGYTYEISDGKAIITRVDAQISGKIEIPQKLGGCEVIGIDKYAFYNRSSISEVVIPEGVKYIGYQAFFGCSGLNRIHIPTTMNEIAENAFDITNHKLAEVHIKSIESWCGISFGNARSNPLNGAKLYINDSEVTELTLPETTDKISNYTFYGFANLQTISFNDKITKIGSHSFEGCTSLSFPTIPESVVEIDESAFENCISFTQIRIPGTVKTIGDAAFAYCKNVNSLNVDFGVTNIGNSAFLAMTTLKNTVIPDSVTSIGEQAFMGCKNLLSIGIGQNVASIGNGTFALCESLVNVNIPDSVTTLGNRMFDGCTALKIVSIGNSVESIGEYTFNRCLNLSVLKLGSKIKSIGKTPFIDCSSLAEVHINDIADWCAIDFADYHSNPLCTAQLFINDKLAEDIYIPQGVTKISQYAFYNCLTMKSIHIPSSVTHLGMSAFDICKNLKSVYLDNMESWYQIDIENGSATPFDYATDLYVSGQLVNELQLPNTMINIKPYTFFGMSSLKSIRLPENLVSIGNNAFSRCYSLEKIVLPQSLKDIDEGAFSACTSIEEIIIPDGIKQIKKHTFYNCIALKVVIIPKSVIYIGQQAFYGCTNISDVYYTGSEEEWEKIDIKDGNDNLLNANIHYYYGVVVTLTYNTNGGNGDIESEQYTPFTDVTITSKKPYRVGCEFLGWSMDQNSDNAQYLPGDTLKIGAENVTLYAIWYRNTYMDVSLINNIYITYPHGVSRGNCVWFACYKGNTCVYSNIYEYSGENVIPFCAHVEYDTAKFGIVNSIKTMEPISEIIVYK